MLLSIALILLCGMSMSWICKKLKLPGLLGMLLTGIVLGPYVLNLLDENILNISSELRKMALIIILMRAGLELDISGLKKIGRPAVMMCFVPASFELLGMMVLAPRLLGLSLLEAAILGSVLAAVSPQDQGARCRKRDCKRSGEAVCGKTGAGWLCLRRRYSMAERI